MATATKERTRNVPNLFSPGGFISGTKQAALSKREQLNDQLTSRVESAKKAGNLGRGPMGAGTEVSTSRNRQHGELRTIATYSPFRPHRTTWCSTTQDRVSGVRSKTACKDWGSTVSTLFSSMTSRLTISSYRPPGRNSLRSRRQAHSLSCP